MTQNPYEAPREAANQKPFDWRVLAIRGLWIAGGSFIALGATVTIGQPGTQSISEVTALLAAIAAGISLHVGIIMAIVGGAGWFVTV